MILVYRPMGDDEITYLVQHNQLPSTQPYQAIIQGKEGREYSEKYLNGQKWTNTHPSTVVEFCMPKLLIDQLFKKQSKAEDGAMSHGLGDKAGNDVKEFNERLGVCKELEGMGREAEEYQDYEEEEPNVPVPSSSSSASSPTTPKGTWRIVRVKRRVTVKESKRKF